MKLGGCVLLSTLFFSNLLSANTALFSDVKVLDGSRYEVSYDKENSPLKNNSLVFDLPEIGKHAFKATRTYKTSKNQEVWLGEGRNSSSVTLVKSAHGITGSIRTATGIWLIKPKSYGKSTVEKFDKKQYQHASDVIDPRLLKRKSNIAQKSEYAIQSNSSSAYNSTWFQSIQTVKPEGFKDHSDIRILVYYSSSALKEYPNLEDLIELDFADANQALINSNIDASYTLAGFIEISDYGTEHNLYDMLNRAGNFERMDEFKEKYDADLVHFYGGNVGWVCGVAFYTANSDGWVNPEYAVGATVPSCAGTLTFAHEVGHNLGARHDRYVEDGGIEDYAYGYTDLENKFKTLMSYSNECDDNGISCTEIVNYSNPEVHYQEVPTGISNDDPKAANNSYLLNSTTKLAANYTGVGYPENFQVTKGTNINDVTLTWSALDGADGYEVKRWQLVDTCPQYTTVWETFQTTSDTQLTIPTDNDEQYCYWVRAYKDFDNNARLYSAPTPLEIGYTGTRDVHISDITPQHITDQTSRITLPFTTNKNTDLSATVLHSNADSWLSIAINDLGNNVYELAIDNTKQISASAIVVLTAGGTHEYIPVQFSGFTNTPPTIEIQENINISQAGTATINFSVNDDGGAKNIKLNYYSENSYLLPNRNISINENELTISLTHEIIGETSFILTAFDGEFQTTKRINVQIDRVIYNAPIIPEEITLYVEGTKPLTRLLPGHSIDNDKIHTEVHELPTLGSVEIVEDKFIYTPPSNLTEDVFTFSSALVQNGDENISTQSYITTVFVKPLPVLQTNFQQKLFGGYQQRWLLTHRGQLWFWGSKVEEDGNKKEFPEPTLILEGDWIDAVMQESNLFLLKADGTLWIMGEKRFYDKSAQWEEISWQPQQIGTDSDWTNLFENDGYSLFYLRKADGSLWRSWHLWDENFDEVEKLPVQFTGLYHWDSASNSSIMLDKSGTVWTQDSGQYFLGRNRAAASLAPVAFDLPATKVFADSWRIYAFTDSQIFGAGSALFISDYHQEATKLTELDNNDWIETSLSEYGFAAITANNELYTASSTGNTKSLGRGEYAVNTLSKVGNDDTWVSAFSADRATFAIKSDGAFWVSGFSDEYARYTLGLNEEPGTTHWEFTKLKDLPENTLGTGDNDQDGILDLRDNDDDNDGIIDSLDVHPDTPSTPIDTDGDGIMDYLDPDDDNDGVNDREDAFPLDASETFDTDHDGIGNNADTDDDNDGVNDSEDAFPLDASETIDTDNDGIGNNQDDDDDNDGVKDTNDAYPLDASRSSSPTTPTSLDNKKSSGGGGSFAWLGLLLVFVLWIRQNKLNKKVQ